MPKDILQDDTGDVLLTGGDISYGESTYQHQRGIMIQRTGDIRTVPGIGVGLEDFTDDEDPEGLLRRVTTHFMKDGMIVEKVALDNVIARYKE